MLIAAMVAMVVLTGCPGCNAVVPNGYLGMVKTTEGMTGEVLQPGHHTCFGRDKMHLIEMQEVYMTEKLSILCADDLNFKFDLKLRCRPKSDMKSINQILKDKGAAMQPGIDGYLTLSFKPMYDTYIKPKGREVARSAVTIYETTQIRDKRDEIKRSIVEAMKEASKTSPMMITQISVSNFDYPDAIEDAMEKKKEREIAIETEKKDQAIKILKADNRMKLAQKMRSVRAAEAQAEGAYMSILGKHVNKNFLTWKKIEADKLLYERVGPGDKFIMDANKATVMINTGKLK